MPPESVPMLYTEDNRPGPYLTNLRNPVIAAEYVDYCQRNSIPVWSAPTDEQRHRFDLMMIGRYGPEGFSAKKDR